MNNKVFSVEKTDENSKKAGMFAARISWMIMLILLAAAQTYFFVVEKHCNTLLTVLILIQLISYEIFRQIYKSKIKQDT